MIDNNIKNIYYDKRRKKYIIIYNNIFKIYENVDYILELLEKIKKTDISNKLISKL